MQKTTLSLTRLTTGPPPANAVAREDCDQADTTEWQERYLGAVFAYALRRVSTREEAEDVTAEVFTAACHPIRSRPLPPTVPPLVFLLGIARRKIADVNRKRRWREIPLSQLFRRQAASDSEPRDPAPSPETTLLISERSRQIRDLVSGLKEEQREALLLHYVEGLSIAEAASVMRKSPAAVNSLLQRGRETLFHRGKAYFLNESSEPTNAIKGASPR